DAAGDERSSDILADGGIGQAHDGDDTSRLDLPHDLRARHGRRRHRSPFTTRASANSSVTHRTALRPALARNSPSAGRLTKYKMIATASGAISRLPTMARIALSSAGSCQNGATSAG